MILASIASSAGVPPAPSPRYPALYQVNTRVWLTELSVPLGRRATLDDIPDAALDGIARRGFDWVWLLSVWQTGAAARAVSLANPEWRREFQQILPDLTDGDIAGSGFAISDYTVHGHLGGDTALARLRERLRRRGLKLMLDFVPNHLAPDHPWVTAHREFFVGGGESDLDKTPRDFFRAATGDGQRIFAHGRDPYLPGWPDTIQLDYGNQAVQEAMIDELVRIAERCDGVRCDMAMLVLPEVFRRTWGIPCEPFWPRAIERVRSRFPGFLFLAEVYWDLEWTLQQQGFDFCYDKRLYDRLRDGEAGPVRAHLQAGLEYQDRLARFLENHDEPRAAAVFDPARHRAAAVLTYLTPGLRFFHQGQLEGRRRRTSPHLARAPTEATDGAIADLYSRLLGVLRRPVVREGRWRLLDCAPAWEGNWTHAEMIAFAWEAAASDPLIVAVNCAGHRSQARVRVPFAVAGATSWRLTDLLDDRTYDRTGAELADRGLWIDLPPWGCHVFAVFPIR